MSDFPSLFRDAAQRLVPTLTPDFEVVERRAQLRRRTRFATRAALSAAAVAGVALVANGVAGPSGSATMPGAVVPGASDPSPFPSPANQNKTGDRDICVDPATVDSRHHLSENTSFDNGAFRLRPPRQAPTSRTAGQVLANFKKTRLSTGGTTQVIFARLSAGSPGIIGKDGVIRRQFDDTPVWLVAICDAPTDAAYLERIRQHGRFGALRAEGTPPSPGAYPFAVTFTLYDVDGRVTTSMGLTRPSPEQLAQTFVTVPWQRESVSADVRQVTISYPAAEPCATFDHLEVVEEDKRVRVRVWLRALPGAPSTCPGDKTHRAIVGLLKPLGSRQLYGSQ